MSALMLSILCDDVEAQPCCVLLSPFFGGLCVRLVDVTSACIVPRYQLRLRQRWTRAPRLGPTVESATHLILIGLILITCWLSLAMAHIPACGIESNSAIFHGQEFPSPKEAVRHEILRQRTPVTLDLRDTQHSVQIVTVILRFTPCNHAAHTERHSPQHGSRVTSAQGKSWPNHICRLA